MSLLDKSIIPNEVVRADGTIAYAFRIEGTGDGAKFLLFVDLESVVTEDGSGKKIPVSIVANFEAGDFVLDRHSKQAGGIYPIELEYVTPNFTVEIALPAGASGGVAVLLAASGHTILRAV